jgi:hypothetical protein
MLQLAAPGLCGLVHITEQFSRNTALPSLLQRIQHAAVMAKGMGHKK